MGLPGMLTNLSPGIKTGFTITLGVLGALVLWNLIGKTLKL
jgi:hypothetical protein